MCYFVLDAHPHLLCIKAYILSHKFLMMMLSLMILIMIMLLQECFPYYVEFRIRCAPSFSS